MELSSLLNLERVEQEKMQGGLVLVVLALCMAAQTSAQRSFDRFRYIDQLKNDAGMTNYLFRGNVPIQDGSMQYDWLVWSLNWTAHIDTLQVQGISTAAKAAGLQSFPQKFYIITFNLLELEVNNATQKFIQNFSLRTGRLRRSFLTQILL